MASIHVPHALQERLGQDGADALAQMFETMAQTTVEDALKRATDRFEHRLGEEVSSLRGEISTLRVEISTLREDLSTVRVELLKWSFLFWTGQILVIVALVGVLLP